MTLAPDGRVIDLDTAGPSDDRSPRRVPRARVHRTAAAVTAAVAIVLTSGSAPPEPRLDRLLSVPLNESGTFLLGADALVLPDPRSSGTITAYELGDGDRRWSTRLADPASTIAVDDENDVVLAETAARATTALDLNTGAVLWTRPGFPFPHFGRSVLVTEYDRPGRPARARLVETRTGVGDWQTPIDDDTSVFATADPPRLVLVRATGETTVHDPADGRTLAAGTLPVTGGDRVDRSVALHGPLLLLRDPDTDRTVLRAYATDTLTPRWATTMPAFAEFARDCGPYVCLRDPTGFVAVDPVHGTIRWTAPARILSADLGRTLLVYDRRDNPTWSLLDPFTGRATLDLGRGAWPGGADDLFLRPEAGNGRTLVARVDVAAGSQRIVGTLPNAVPDTCRARGARLACPTTGNQLELWGD